MIQFPKTGVAMTMIAAFGAEFAWSSDGTVSLNGDWRFAVDSLDTGFKDFWFAPGFDRSDWGKVRVRMKEAAGPPFQSLFLTCRKIRKGSIWLFAWTTVTARKPCHIWIPSIGQRMAASSGARG